MGKKKPLDRLLTAGADLKNPGRFRGRRGPVRTYPLGDPYRDMPEPEQAFWREFASNLPWLRGHHRLFLRLTCHLAARNEAGTLGVTAQRLLVQCLAKLGATPTDEGKLASVDPEDEPDPSEAFFRKQ